MNDLTIKEVIARELHKPMRRNYQRRRVETKHRDDLWQADLADLSLYGKENNNRKYILVVIDTYSKYSWARPLKHKDGLSVTNAMKSVLDSEGRKPNYLQTDKGTEFFNRNFSKLLESFNIKHYHTFSPLKASIVERMNRTLKEKMFLRFSVQGSYRWVDILQDLIDNYNRTVHRTIKMRPIDVKSSTRIPYFHQQLSMELTSSLKGTKLFKVGDYVRISKQKSVFEKGYTPNWTAEIFRVRKVQLTRPTTYLLEDYQQNNIQGCFYKEELQRVKFKDLYLIEKILKRKGNKVYVKWLGFNNDHNSWINEKEIL